VQLTRNFRLDELTRSAVAARYGIDNTPIGEILSNLRITAFGLEQVRAVVGRPVRVTSGYRCPALNAHRDVRGSATSAHLTGYAADILVDGMSAMGLAQAIRDSRIAFDQVILETSRGVVHVGFAPSLRRQVLTQAGAAGSAIASGLV
jgi:uncharacterized protein YcbK (DUF882 family)